MKKILVILILTTACASIPPTPPMVNAKLTQKSNITALLIHYGSELNDEELKYYATIIERRFSYATESTISLSVENQIIIPLLQHDYSIITNRFPWISNESAQRIWYYYENADMPTREIWQFLENSQHRKESRNTDIIIVLSETQHENFGYVLREKNGIQKIIMIEYPIEIAWADEKSYNTEIPSVWRTADTVIHEIGHILGFRDELSFCPPPRHPNEKNNYDACIRNQSIMSYGRDRELASETFVYKFSDEHIEYLKRFLKN